MKASLILLGAAALICLAHAVHEHIPTHVADKHYLMKQKLIYELFWHIDQPTLYHPELYQKARSFSIEDNIDSYTDKDVVMEFLHHWKHSMLPRGHVFSMAYPHLEEEAICLFKLLYVAKDFDTFYNTAVWARFRVNEQMFVYALTVAVIHRPDTKHIHIPPLYEVLPHLFFNDDVINHAYRIGMGDTSMRKVMGGMDSHVIHANYSHWYMILDDVPENKLSYYTEDVGLNYFYFMVSHDYPYWMKSVDYHLDKEIRGELYFFVHKQLLARYNLERLSHDMEEIDFVDYTKPIVHGHHPNMHYHNGLPVPHRVRHTEVPLHMHDVLMELEEWESRVHHAIDIGHVVDHMGKHIDIYTREGLNVLGNIIQGNADSVNHKYYGHMDRHYKKVLGHSPMPTTKYNVVPSAMEIYVMNMRDHIFYSMYKNIVNYWMKYKSHLPSYTHEDLVFPGVKIESVTVDKLVTFFDTFDSMISNAISIRNHKDAQAMVIKARQMRLNHKPFTYHITVHSDKDTKAMVRVFLGPKYNVHGHEMDLDESHMHYVEMDQWVVDLKVGTNKIEHGSHESFYGMPDVPSSEVLYKKMVKAMEGGETYTYSHQLYGFPDRLMLPKGKHDGMPFKLFVFISHFDEHKSYKMDSPVWGTAVVDHHSIGFPLDRHVHSHNFTVPNMYMKDVMIYHKHGDELNIPQ